MASAKKSTVEFITASEAEQIEKCKIKLTITVGPERLREGLSYAYNRSKHYFNIPGFRKGKAPRRIIEQMYGKEVFHEDAMNFILPDAYEAALEKHEIEPVYKPEIDPGEINETEGVTFYATVHVRPEVEIGEYTGLTYPKGDTEATEEDIDPPSKRKPPRSNG
jgi:trigger factor